MQGIKKIILKVYSDGTVLTSSDVLGYIGEHRSGELIFELPSLLKDTSYTYTLNFEDEKNNVWVASLPSDYTFVIPMALTQGNLLSVQLIITQGTTVVFKSSCVEFRLHRGVDMVEVTNKYTGLLEDTLEKFNNLINKLGDYTLTNLRGVVSIEKTAVNGLEDTYTISYTDGTTNTFTITNGRNGEKGNDGESYILTDNDKREIAELIVDEYPINVFRTVNTRKHIANPNTTFTNTPFTEGEI
ncbi:MAG: hypothetical protein UE295_10565 [Acutalibacteraceae bacterium]|nr:hypothetical protein [Acutalibacteraceae bacterium]